MLKLLLIFFGFCGALALGIGIICTLIFGRVNRYTKKTKENILDHSFDGTVEDGIKNILISEPIIVDQELKKRERKINPKKTMKDIINRGSVIYDEIYGNPTIVMGKYLSDK